MPTPPITHTPAFQALLTQAVAELSETGFDSEATLSIWLDRLRAAALSELPREAADAYVRSALTAAYERLVERGALMRHHPDLDRFTLARVKPSLRAELGRRIAASAELIRLNRTQAIETTLRRFAGWGASLPPGDPSRVNQREITSDIRKPLSSLSYAERRVAIDQGHKLLSNLSEVLATDGGALAGRWAQHYTRNPRKAHTERNGKTYLVRDSWALRAGLVTPGDAGYTDDVTRPGEEPLCRCTMTWLHSLGRLPPDMLTAAGRAELARVRAAA